LLKGGFYKRGCQVKTLLLTCRERIFSDIQPLLAAAIHFARARFSFSHSREALGVIFVRVLPAASFALASSVMAIANHGSI
jgi:hypothetical protein